jgi:phosphopentomutase
MRELRRVLLVVFDGLGIGAVDGRNPAELAGAHSLRNALGSAAKPGDFPFLQRLGLFAAAGMADARPHNGRAAYNGRAGRSGHSGRTGHAWGRTRQLSDFPESYSCHWEMAGHVPESGHGHPQGLDARTLDRITAALGFEVVGNVGCYPHLDRVPPQVLAEHRRTGRPILLAQAEIEPVSTIGVYADPAVTPPDLLFARVAEAAAKLSREPVVPGRLVARLFDLVDSAPVLRPDRTDHSFFRFEHRTVLHGITGSGRDVFGTGKVGRLFNGEGFTRSWDEWGSPVIERNTREAWSVLTHGLLWVNFNDLNRPFGAGRDSAGWLDALHRYDRYAAGLHELLEPEDLMIVTGDHGTDPTLTGGHTYEWTPLLITGAGVPDVKLGDRRHIDLAATLAEVWNCGSGGAGTSLSHALWGRVTPE